jgi:small subunit ribosomal protein S18
MKGTFMARRNKCAICKDKMVEVDYKDVATIGRYLDRWSKISPALRNNNCARHQRQAVVAIKRARFLALLPFTVR